MKEKIGWLVNDRLTCIPDTKTFWHFLLEKFPNLVDKTGGYTPFHYLGHKIENDFLTSVQKPAFIIRNATFFPKINLEIPTISFLQDPYYGINQHLFDLQIEVCNSSDYVVYNSEYTKQIYKTFIHKPSEVVPIGTDSDLFFPGNKTSEGITIGYIGSSDEQFKGFSMMLDIIKNTNYNFVLIMKDNFKIKNERVKVYNNISQEKVSDIIRKEIDILVCTSKNETLHLAGIESMFCDVPVVSSNVGIYKSLTNDDRWGRIVKDHQLSSYLSSIEEVLQLKKEKRLQPRQCMFDKNLSLNNCKKSWQKIIEFM